MWLFYIATFSYAFIFSETGSLTKSKTHVFQKDTDTHAS